MTRPRTKERIGRPEWIVVQRADGKMVEALMHPVLDEFGGVVRWVTPAQAYAMTPATVCSAGDK